MICRFPVPLDKSENGVHRIIYVPCGKCAWCLRQKRNEWFVRFVEESKTHLFTRFVTLDYDLDHVPLKMDESTGELVKTVSLEDVQKFHKRLRNMYKFRFFLASEYGKKTGHPHYHAIYWSDERIPFLDYWKNGENGADLPATPASFKYVTKYILKGSFVPDGADPLFHTMSRKPGIGVSYLDHCRDDLDELRPFYRYYNKMMRLPSYYTRKVNDLLPDDLKKSISESKIDYLATQSKYESLLNSYIENAPSDQSIEDWISDIYGKDFRKQIKINSK